MGKPETKKSGGRKPAAAFSLYVGDALELDDVLRLESLGTLGDFERNLIVLAQGFESFRLDGRVVDKQILTTVLGRDETIPFRIVKPLHCSCRHTFPQKKKLK